MDLSQVLHLNILINFEIEDKTQINGLSIVIKKLIGRATINAIFKACCAAKVFGVISPKMTIKIVIINEEMITPFPSPIPTFELIK